MRQSRGPYTPRYLWIWVGHDEARALTMREEPHSSTGRNPLNTRPATELRQSRPRTTERDTKPPRHRYPTVTTAA